MITADENTITECASCGQAFGGLPLSSGSQAMLAKCSACDRRYYVTQQTEPPASMSLGDQAAFGFSPARHLSDQQASALQAILTSHIYPADEVERRQQPRYAINSPLMVIPLNSEFHPTATALEASCVDISSVGLSFTVKSSAEASFWLVDLAPTLGTSIQVMMRIVRMEPLGGDTWKVAGPFITDHEVASWSS